MQNFSKVDSFGFHYKIKTTKAKDKIHDSFKIALENEGWLVTDDPFFMKIGKIPILIDLGAEKFYAAEKENIKIAVEVKTFGNASFITALYEAVGKFVVYRKALEILKKINTRSF